MLGVQSQPLSELLASEVLRAGDGLAANWGCPQNLSFNSYNIYIYNYIFIPGKWMEIEHDVPHLPNVEVPKMSET